MTNFETTLGQYPIIGMVISLFQITIGYAIETLEIPLIIMQLFQLGAWFSAMAIGVFTVRAYIKKQK